MDLRSVSSMPAGCRANVLVDVHSTMGHEVPFGTSLAFRYVGPLNQRIMLYNVAKTHQWLQQHSILELDPKYVPLGVNRQEPLVLVNGQAHELRPATLGKGMVLKPLGL